MKIAYVLEFKDECNSSLLPSMVLEELYQRCGFNPKMDVPFCISYYDLIEIDEAKESIAETLLSRLKYNLNIVDDTDSLSLSIDDLANTILAMAPTVDFSLMTGLDMIVGEEDAGRILFYFDKEQGIL